MKHSTFVCLLTALPVTGSAAETGSSPCIDEQGGSELISLVNQLRKSRDLGQVSSSEKLTAAAKVQSQYMSEQNKLGHAGPDGNQVSDRVEAQAYTYRIVAENVAAGQQGVDAVMSGWESSPSHLENMLRPEVVDIGLACVSDEDSKFGTWWTMVLAAPLDGGR